MRLAPMLVAVFAGGAVTSFATAPQSLHTVMKITRTGGAKAQPPVTMEFWMKGGKLRSRTSGLLGPSGQIEVVQITSGAQQIVFRPNDPKKNYMLVPVPPMLQANSMTDRLRLLSMVPPKATKKKVGTATILGYPSSIYEVKVPNPNPKGKSVTAKLWEATVQGSAYPVKSDTVIGQEHVMTETTRLDLNPNLPDSLFSPDHPDPRSAVWSLFANFAAISVDGYVGCMAADFVGPGTGCRR